jgi:DNA helicase HerA-like ATPase
MREGRAFGLGVVVASQYPDDLIEAIAGTINTKLYFSQSLPEKVRAIQRALSVNRQYPSVQVALKPYFERI